MKSLYLETTDPSFNLAFEEHLFNNLTPDHPGWFLLWRNRPSIIVGRHQNTLEEINPQFVEKYNLDVIRRMTGGGAVFHDLGNINYSFLHNAEEGEKIDFPRYLAPIIEALASIGVKAEHSSRNDITVDGKKISGTAQTRKGRKVLHHGTMLVELNIDMLEAALTGAPDKYVSKGISSVRSRVANLSETWPQGTTFEQMEQAFLSHCSSAKAELQQADLEAAEALAKEKYRTWDWNYGRSPEYTSKERERFPWGAVELRLQVKKGVILDSHISGDFFALKDLSDVTERLKGIRHTPEAISAALGDLNLGDYFTGCDAQEQLDFFTRV